MQRPLLRHVQACSRRAVDALVRNEHGEADGNEEDNEEDVNSLLDAVHMLGRLYADQGKLTLV
jgi:hypothetical protein